MEDALRYGGELTRAAIGAMNIRGDRKYLVVDSKVHMLMPGWTPAIPGWHTDGVPRGDHKHAKSNRDVPNLDAQVEIEESGRGTRFHMLVTGVGCLTEFVNGPLELTRNPSWDTTALYRDITVQVNDLKPPTISSPTCTAIDFDWWDVHRGVPATVNEWRFFIRVSETDLDAPSTDLRRVIRTHTQVYAPNDFGW